MRDPDSKRTARERDYHNRRAYNETREHQGKYYAAIKDGAAEFDRRMKFHGTDTDILEYGCGALPMSHSGGQKHGSLTCIDISDAAISIARKQLGEIDQLNARFAVMDAEQLSFDDDSFDLIFGRGILHHLDLVRCFSEISRVLRPNGTALFWEPLGHNPFVNGYRRITPRARSVDEHPLRKKDFEIAHNEFSDVNLRFYGLTTLVFVPFRDNLVGDFLFRFTSTIDRALFYIPGIKWQAWYTLITLSGPRKSGKPPRTTGSSDTADLHSSAV
jgi:SAM-dependent methyltransferase